MPQGIDFGFSFGAAAAPRGKRERGPLRVLLLGDFSARPASEKPPLADRPSHRIDFDTLDEVMRRLSPRLRLADLEIGFDKLDDLHPEQLYARLPLFQQLREARSRPISSSRGTGLLDQLLGKTGAATPDPRPSTATGLDGLLRQLVAPHIVPDQAASLQAQQATVDAVVTEQMRRLLHEPTFQRLEAAWRGVQWLIANLELDAGLELHLLDVSRDELLADIVDANGQLAQTGLHSALVKRTDGPHWAALLGLYQFGASAVDVGLLAALGLLAAQAGAPLLAGGDPGVATLEAADQARWQALRKSEAAPWIGLVAPRLLLRLPYGKKSDPVEGFAFEEFDATPVHEEFLWGNGALAVALLLGRALGSGAEHGADGVISALPAYSYLHDGERELQAAAEHHLGEAAGLALLAAGLMPLLSHRHSSAVTVIRMQSVAEPAQALAGLRL